MSVPPSIEAAEPSKDSDPQAISAPSEREAAEASALAPVDPGLYCEADLRFNERPPEACLSADHSRILSPRLVFAHRKYELDEAARSTLAQLAQVINALPKVQLEIAAHVRHTSEHY